MRGKRVDANHAEVRDALRQRGWDVEDFSNIGGGIPDLLAVHRWRQHSWRGRLAYLVEVKDGEKPPSARRLTAAQERVHAAFSAAGIPVVVVTSVTEAMAL